MEERSEAIWSISTGSIVQNGLRDEDQILATETRPIGPDDRDPMII